MAKRTSKKSAKAKATDAAKGSAHTTYHKDGSIYAEGRMLGGKMHGYWEFFRKDGTIMRSGSFDREQQIGTWTTYDAGGQVVKITEMKPRAGSRGTAASGGGGKTATTAAAKRVHHSRIHKDILSYNAAQAAEDRRICDALAQAIERSLRGAECKVWHGHPVWFLEGNPIVGYSKLKDCIHLLFWSGQSFDEPGLVPEGSFKAAEARFTSEGQISQKDLKRWLAASIKIQWDYKNIVKRRGRLVRVMQVGD